MIRFEYDKYDNRQNIDVDALDTFLQQVWRNSKDAANGDIIIDDGTLKQPYLKIRNGKFKPRNYIGFIYFNDKIIEIYPKIFEGKLNKDNKAQVYRNILYWLNYYQKFKIPHLDADLDFQNFDSFLEIFLYLITDFIHETVYSQPYHQFQEIERTLYTPKGRIDFNDYILRKIPAGEWHKLNCTYTPFIYDNLMNQVIKYTCRLIDDIAKNTATKSLLRDIFFIMDEVSDRSCTVYDIDSIFVNPLFNEYVQILIYCRMILEQQFYSNQSLTIKQLCFLFPMEKIYEDFVYGKLSEHITSLERQKSNMFLAKIDGHNVFVMKHDIFSNKPPFIVDTKYKIRADANDRKFGVSQSDLYQMISYGFRRGIKNLYLFYPNENELTVSKELTENTFTVQSNFDGFSMTLNITAKDIPFWSFDDNFKIKIDIIFEEIARELQVTHTLQPHLLNN